MRAIYKDDGSLEIDTLVKEVEEGELLSVVYAPDIEDSQGDVASAEVVKQMAYDFIANGAKVDIQHDFKDLPADAARIAETFLVHKSDDRFHGWTDVEGNPVNLTGAWATVIKIDDSRLRELYRNGEWGGVSMAGRAEVEALSEKEARLEAFAKTFQAKMKGTTTSNTEIDMDEKTLAEIVAKSVGDATKPLSEAVSALAEIHKKQAETEDEPKKDEPQAPVFKGDPSDEQALLKHERALELFELKKAHDLATAEGIRGYREALAELKKTWDEADAKVRKSNQDNEDETPASVGGVSRTDADLLKAGADLIKSTRK